MNWQDVLSELRLERLPVDEFVVVGGAALVTYLDVDCGTVRRRTDLLLERAESVDGIRVIDLDSLSAFKGAYARPKDALDLALINRHRANAA